LIGSELDPCTSLFVLIIYEIMWVYSVFDLSSKRRMIGSQKLKIIKMIMELIKNNPLK